MFDKKCKLLKNISYLGSVFVLCSLMFLISGKSWAQAVPPRGQALLMMYPYGSCFNRNDHSDDDDSYYSRYSSRSSYHEYERVETVYEPTRPPPPPKKKRGVDMDYAALISKEYQQWNRYWDWEHDTRDTRDLANPKIVVDLNGERLFRVFLFDDENAKYLYKDFETQDHEAVKVDQDGDITTKKFRINSVGGLEHLYFVCSRHKVKNLHRCALEATKKVDGDDEIPLFRFQETDDAFIVRNDTDNLNSVEVTTDLFPVLEERNESVVPIVKNLKNIPFQMRIGKGFFRFTIVKPAITSENDKIKMAEDPYTLQVLLKDQENARLLFEQMGNTNTQNLVIENEGAITYKTFYVESDMGGNKQTLAMVCWKEDSAQPSYFCRLSVDKVVGSNTMGIRVHDSKDPKSADTLIVRNDTDNTAVGKSIFDLFTNYNLQKGIPSGIDPQLGVNTSGGEGFVVPSR